MAQWHLITGEYPPDSGGVGDYSRQIAVALAAAGDQVHVWVPASSQANSSESGVELHRRPGHLGLNLSRLSRTLAGSDSARLLVQYAPHAFGFRAMNLPFCLWLYVHRHRVPIDVMFHEVAFPIRRGQPVRHNLLGAVQRAMAMLAARAADRIFVASAAWSERLKPLLARPRDVIWLPVPSNIPVTEDRCAVAAVRRRYADEHGLILGHFGTYRADIARSLMEVIPAVMREHQNLALLLSGYKSFAFRARLLNTHPDLNARVHATGRLEATRLSCVLSACDVMLQPYPDGVDTRRGSMMAVLAHGRATVANLGSLSEPLWRDEGVIAVEDDADAMAAAVKRLLADESLRRRMEVSARHLYQRFDLSHTIAAVRAVTCASQ
ncbi:MAG: glycosyltransferase family 4 protein [Candidatus Binataceae bacterium]